jgi:Flp pilus assembly protein TadG
MPFSLKKFTVPLRKDQDGTSIVEFAVVAPVMFTLLLGGFDLGHNLYMRSVLQGAVNKAARDSALETGTAQEVQERVDASVKAQVLAVHGGAKIRPQDFERSFFRTFTDAAFPDSEVILLDGGELGVCEDGEKYIDENNSGAFEADGVADGQGYTRDAVKYTVTVRYDRLFPFPSLAGLDGEVEMSASTVIANQPYGERIAPVTLDCVES